MVELYLFTAMLERTSVAELALTAVVCRQTDLPKHRDGFIAC
jgi:hypothetical protein